MAELTDVRKSVRERYAAAARAATDGQAGGAVPRSRASALSHEPFAVLSHPRSASARRTVGCSSDAPTFAVGGPWMFHSTELPPWCRVEKSATSAQGRLAQSVRALL